MEMFIFFATFGVVFFGAWAYGYYGCLRIHKYVDERGAAADIQAWFSGLVHTLLACLVFHLAIQFVAYFYAYLKCD